MTARDHTLAEASSQGYDRLAPIYRTLEYLAFGPTLERARFAHLKGMQGCQRILLIGDGDGRCVARLASLPECHGALFEVVELSAGMAQLSEQRMIRLGLQDRVRYHVCSLLDFAPEPMSFDGVVTCFFLDQFAGQRLEACIEVVAGLCTDRARWINSDFRLPERGMARTYARLWLKILYLFFQATTDIDARNLEDPTPLMQARGFQLASKREFLGGFTYSNLWRADFN